MSAEEIYKAAVIREKDGYTAVPWYEKAAEKGYVQAQFHLGGLYAEGRRVSRDGVPQDAAKAAQWYQKAAEQGHAEAQYALGWMYSEGRGVPRNNDKAVQWFQKAAAQGHAKAQFRLRELYAQGRGVPQDDAKVATAKVTDFNPPGDGYLIDISKPAEKRNVPAEGNAQENKAAQRSKSVAGQGDPPDENSLGFAIGQGLGDFLVNVVAPAIEAVAPPDLATIQQAAERGDVGSQAQLGNRYLHGRGVPKDDVKAAGWYSKAATQGHAVSQGMLGGMYLRGQGVKRDREKGCALVRASADQGVQESVASFYNFCLDKKADRTQDEQDKEIQRFQTEIDKLVESAEALGTL